MRLIVLAMVTLIFEGWIYEYPDAMAVRDGKVVDAATGEEVKAARRVEGESKPAESQQIYKVGIT